MIINKNLIRTDAQLTKLCEEDVVHLAVDQDLFIGELGYTFCGLIEVFEGHSVDPNNPIVCDVCSVLSQKEN